MSTQPLILLTNDDGIHSPGLKAAAEAVAHLGDVLIVAPRYQQTAMSRSLPVAPDMGIIETFPLEIGGQTLTIYGVHGSPAQAVKHAILELAPRKPSLCVSGINYGENLGASITVSGTVGAAIEASTHGIPSLAISTETDIDIHHSDSYGHLNWETASYFTAHFASTLLARGLPPEIALLNINVPATATHETQIRVTAQSRQSYFLSFAEQGRDFAASYRFQYGVKVDLEKLELNSDIRAFLQDRVVTVTPLGLDLTARIPLQEWFSQFQG